MPKITAQPPKRTLQSAQVARPDTVNVKSTAPKGAMVGFGAQFDTDLFTAKGEPKALTPAQLKDLQNKLDRLKPAHVRVFVKPEMLTPGPEQTALVKTLQLAQNAGSSVNLTWWHGPYPKDPTQRAALMDSFGQLVGKLRNTDALTCVKDITLQNEVNSVDIAHQGKPLAAMQEYESLYRDLDKSLRAIPDPAHPKMGTRAAVRFVGGDLVEGKRPDGSCTQDDWLHYMDQHMSDVLDGYSVHIYWPPNDRAKMENRLTHLQQVVAGMKHPKPIYVTEYGIKGLPGKMPGTKNKATTEPGLWDGQIIENTPRAGFEHALFNALAPQYGVIGAVKWAAYGTDGHTFQGWGELRSASTGFATTPTFRVESLFSHAIPPGFKAVGLGRNGEETVSKFVGPKGQSTVMALNGNSTSRSVKITGLQPGAAYHAAVWNRDGKGSVNHEVAVTVNKSGTVTIPVPSMGVVALTTQQLGI